MEERLEDIAQEIIETKEKIYDLNQHLADLEMRAIAIVGHNTEGSRTVQLDGMSVQTVGKVTRTIDAEKLREIWNDLPPRIRNSVIKLKPSLDIRKYRDLRAFDEEAWYKISEAIISKPAKTSVNIKLFEGE